MRDWAIAPGIEAWFPYAEEGLLSEDELDGALNAIWPWREPAWARRTFQKQSYKEEGRAFYEWHQIALDRHRTPLALTWAYKHTGVNFALSRGGCVFNKHAPFLKLASEELPTYLKLAAVLNSSVACFWLKQVCQDTGVGGIGGGIGDEAWEPRYEFGAGRVGSVPLADGVGHGLAAALDSLAGQSIAVPELGRADTAATLRERLARWRDEVARTVTRMISLQEELDWHVLAAYGLVPKTLPVIGEAAPAISLGERAFEIVLARQLLASNTNTTWFERHGSKPRTNLPPDWPEEYLQVVEQRIALIEADPDVGLIERPEHKRRWQRASWDEHQDAVLKDLIIAALGQPNVWADLRPRSTAELTDHLRGDPVLMEALEHLAARRGDDPAATTKSIVLESAVPHLASQRLTEPGLRKRGVWEQTWDLQRREDRGEEVGAIVVPPKYVQADFRSADYWRHRGKLDVPKERFVLIPNGERGADTSPVVGWAGWCERDLARALAGRIVELREQEAADAERVAPLLAGVLELLPWISQWHPESDPLFGGAPGKYFEAWLDGQLAELGITRDNLRAWRPPGPTRGRKAKAGAA